MASLPRNDSETTLYDESTPLLYQQVSPDAEAQKIPAAKISITPLPKAQLAALCSIRLADPIAFTQVFPYINEFITSLHLTEDPSRIGFYSGLVESSFALAQLCSIYQWAKISDIIGRRPVVIAGTLGLALTTILLGLSRNLNEILLARCLAGLFSGNVAVIHSVLGELTDSTNQALAFPIYGLFWPLGSIIGPLIGGSFSNPATRFPRYFNQSFFLQFPYFLPCFIAGLLGILAVIMGYYCLDETLPSKRRICNPRRDYTFPNASESTDAVEAPLQPPRPLSMTELLSIPRIRALCASGCVLSFIATAFDVVFVLFCYSPIQTGGLGFSASQIGYSLATAGGISAAIQLFFMPTLLRTFDIVNFYNFCMSLWPFTFIALPILHLIAHNGLDVATGTMDPGWNSILWIGIGLTLGCSRIGCLAYSISMILAKENTPSPASLGATNGLVQFSMCLSRAVSPAFVSSAFALSIDNDVLWGQMWVAVMVAICFFGTSMAKNLKQ